jgi:hypothetical protein
MLDTQLAAFPSGIIWNRISPPGFVVTCAPNIHPNIYLPSSPWSFNRFPRQNLKHYWEKESLLSSTHSAASQGSSKLISHGALCCGSYHFSFVFGRHEVQVSVDLQEMLISACLFQLQARNAYGAGRQSSLPITVDVQQSRFGRL